MTDGRTTIKLKGCSPQPLGSYLKALGIFRIISEQADPEAEACWRGDRFFITSHLGEEDIIHFLAESYQPTPIMAPWNGGSGFYPKDNLTAIDTIRESDGNRLEPYREALHGAKQLMAKWSGKPSKDDKELLLQACRALLPDRTVDWLDAAFVLGTETPRYPPLLGTGGNDGRLEFTNNFMQRLTDVMDQRGEPHPPSLDWLCSSLFGILRPGLLKGQPIGQFDPARAGGANTTTGYEGESMVNPWDYILMIEGSLLFASGVVRRGETNLHGELSYPFSVKTSGVGYGSASKSDEGTSRAELWVPIWGTPSRYPELRALFSEGRSNVERRKAVDGVDFARAVASLGVDRGIDTFQRFAFMERNGRSYFAVPLGRHSVMKNPQADLLAEIDDWLSGFRTKVSGEKAPSSIKRTVNELDRAILNLCAEESPRSVQSMLIALGECERALCISSKWTEEQHLWPVPALSPEWFAQSNDGSIEFKIAAAIALISAERSSAKPFARTIMRETVEPITIARRSGVTKVSWNKVRSLPEINGMPVETLNWLMRARMREHLMAGADGYLDSSPIKASLADVAAFLDCRLDEGRMMRLFWGFVLMDPYACYETSPERPSFKDYPGAAYSLLKLCHVRNIRQIVGSAEREKIPLVAEIHHRASSGNLLGSSKMACSRLRSSGLVPKINEITLSPEQSKRVAASLLIPLESSGVRFMAENILLEMDG